MRSISISGRRESKIDRRKLILIVCEGSKTEPNYFTSFRLPKHIVDIEGSGANTGAVVKEAERIAKQNEYDEVWCVFDRDSFPRQTVNAAIIKAEKLGFKTAFSNESFELWYILHFCYLDTQLSRHQYCERLSGFLGQSYEKNSVDIYDRLLALQNTAINNAKRLDRSIASTSWANRIPYTGVYLLVQRLNFYAKKYSGI